MKDEDKSRSRLLNEISELRRLHTESEAAKSACRLAEEVLRESEMRFRSLASSAVDAIISINARDEIIFWNPAAQATFGYSEAEVMGKLVTMLIPARYRAEHSRGVEQYLQTRVPSLIGRTAELQGLKKDGTEFPLELSLSTWKTVEGVFFSGIIRDISDRKEAERALQQRTEEARQRTEELESLVQMVAHDLKSPVISMTGFVRLLGRELDRMSLDEKTLQFLDQITSISKTMEHFLRDLLDGLAIEQSVPERLPVRLDEKVQEVVQQHQMTCEERGITVQVDVGDPLPCIAGDTRRLRQVLDNLVTNAIRHMGDNPYPRIRIQVLGDGDSVVTRISDNGVGIPVEYHSRIFDRFFRVPKAGNHGGTGLGLFIVKKIVESLGGRIWVESEVGQGTTFVFTLQRCPTNMQGSQ
jgi:PAS domain S-box-containing protein